ncbi:MAG: AsmA family protein, partial [Rhodospirillaceae bacterium]|nr:AsmA family protein [Rhodospirillaceae bacterium]
MQIIGGLGVGVFIATLFVAWRLSTGPVSLSFLTPTLQDSLNELHDGSLDITLEDTILTWAGWERTLDIRMVNMRASLENGEQIASVPEVSVSFSARALLEGIIAPRSIEFFGPDLVAVRDVDGNFKFGFEGSNNNSGEFATKLLGAMLQTEMPSNPMSYLSRVNVVSGQLTYVDNMMGITWNAPMADARLHKIESGLEAELSLGIDISGKVTDISIQGTFDKNIKRFDFGISFEQLNPLMLAQMFPEIDMVSAIDVPLSGTVTFNAASDGQIESLGFDLIGDGGYIALPVKLAAEIDMLPYAQRIKIDGLKTIGRFEGGYQNIEINELDINLADGEKVYLPSPLDMEMPLKRIALAGRYAGNERQIEIAGAEIDLGGPIAKIRAKINGINWPGSGAAQDAISLGLSGVLYDMQMERLSDFWPKIVAVDARKWVLEHMPTGISPKAEISLSMISTKDGVHFEKLEGAIEGQGITVNYLPPMPGVSNASGRATFDGDSFDITLNRTVANDGIIVNGGEINFTKLNTDDPEADFRLDISGPIASSLALIDNEPFNFAKEIGIDPKKTSGDSETTLKIHFPFKRDLGVEDVTASATSKLVGAEFSEILFDRDLSVGNLEIQVDNAKLSAIGTAKLGGVPVGLLWHHDFSNSAIFRDKYELTGRIDNVLGLGDMGIKFPQIISNYLSGGVEANVSYTVFGDDTRSLSARIDLANIYMASPELGWSKQVGVPGNAVLELRLKGENPVEIPSFEISAPEMDVAGSAIFREDGKIDVINIKKVITRRTSFSGSMVPHDDGTWEVSLLGDEFDASVMWRDFLGVGKDLTKGSLDETEFVFSGAADFKTLWFAENRAVHDFIGTIYRKGKLWKK